MIQVIRYVPLLAFVVVAYNIVAAIGVELLDSTLFSIGLLSGSPFTFQVKDALMLAGLLLLYGELSKATRTTTVSIADHTLSLGLLLVCLVELIVVPFAGTSTFFLLTVMTLIDVIAGFTITISGARRDLTAIPPVQ
ncbi:hypothetical protein EDC65_1718 [Stella humosa]|uniref:Transmembrane protein n=1 Tax=Stella humosa TaxID=94 RepID=A0A3N1LXK5_9PROT|nr:hypothetical protein [Stella humosa]ROP99923.1 hypothetical protein EDC65_1718 [Stella humosa]BBK30847.1 hypothetical protein STHU_14810 [Stella humosa]